MHNLAAVLVLFLPALAYGQPSRPSSDTGQMVANDCARARALNKQCVLDIGPEVIDGAGVKPEGSIISTRIFGEHTSLVRIRRDFIAEILKSANDVD